MEITNMLDAIPELHMTPAEMAAFRRCERGEPTEHNDINLMLGYRRRLEDARPHITPMMPQPDAGVIRGRDVH